METINRFYHQLDEFKSKLEATLIELGRHKELEELRIKYEMLTDAKKINIMIPINMYYEQCICGKDRTTGLSVTEQIVNNDETFFLGRLDKRLSDKSLSQDLEENDLALVISIRSIWDSLSPEKKSTIWKYVKILGILAEKELGYTTFQNLLQEKRKNTH